MKYVDNLWNLRNVCQYHHEGAQKKTRLSCSILGYTKMRLGGGTKMRLGGNQNAKIKQAVFLAAEFGDVLGGLSRKQKHVGDDWKKCHEFHFYKNHENAARCCFKEILFVVTVATFSTTP